MAAWLHYIIDIHIGGGLKIYNLYWIYTAAGAPVHMFSYLHRCLFNQGLHTLSKTVKQSYIVVN